MKAVTHHRYGSPDVLQLKEVDIPVPNSNEILVKVHAATVNRTDCANLQAKPFLMRFILGLFKPKKTISGTDFGGTVEQVGQHVKSLNVGDKVFGFDDIGLRSHAEYLSVDENKAVIIPENISFEQAAASIEGAHYAQNFVNKVILKPEHKVMINGGTGAIGSALVQLIKAYGCTLTATCREKDIKLIKSLGADNVIDYENEDFTKDFADFDFVFDAVGKSTFGKSKALLKPGGIYISSELGPYAQNVFYFLFKRIMGSRKVYFPYPDNIPASLHLVKKLMEEGKFTPLIDRVYPLEEIKEAFKYVLKGQKTGNVVIKISN